MRPRLLLVLLGTTTVAALAFGVRERARAERLVAQLREAERAQAKRSERDRSLLASLGRAFSAAMAERRAAAPTPPVAAPAQPVEKKQRFDDLPPEEQAK